MAGTDRQQDAITNHDTSLVVSAGAGTGKTYVLVNKYMNLLLTFGEVQPRQDRLSVLNILALTFTEKAAAEMKERIRSELEKKDGDYWEKARLEFLIAPVQTFHSFCANVLREFAFEAGLEPSFAVLDEQEFSRILAISFQELIHTRAEGDEERALISTLSLIGAHSLEKMIRYLYSRRDEADQFFARLMHDQDSLISHWQEEIRAFRENEVNSIKNSVTFQSMVQSLLEFSSIDVPADDKAMIYLQKVRPFLESMLGSRTVEEFLAASGSFLNEKIGGGGSKKNWEEDTLDELKATNKTLHDWLKKDALPLVTMIFIPDEPFSVQTIRFLQALGVNFRTFCTIVDKKKSDAGGMDFTDLIRYTRQLFRTKREMVASYYAKRYRYILIDEFQDTDPAQFEIVTTIIGEPSPDVQSLFIVGDPKQSIYLFRDADVTRFRDARELITGPCAGREIPLDVCFRSSPAVVTYVNHLFTRLFQTAEKPWEFPYDAIKVSDERANHTGSVTLMLIRQEAGITENDAVADRIEEMIRNKTTVYEEGPRNEEGRTFSIRPAAYGDIAILLERRTHLGLYIHSLATRNIPYYVHKGTGFYNRQEILDLISLLSVLYHPYDDIHLIGLLRSPYFGLSDLDILRISRKTGNSFTEKLRSSCGEFPGFGRVHTLLSGWQKKAGRLRLVPLIQLILDESGILAVYGGLIEGDQILSNIGKLLDIVRTREESGRYHLPDLVADLHDALDREEQEGEAMIDDPDMNAVTIMTVHAAKGLEFPIVFVPEMAAKPNLTQDPILMDSHHDLMGVILPDPAADFTSAKTPIYTILKKDLDERLLAEKRRLLYVALTRSSDHLIMSGEIGDVLPDGSNHTRLDWIIPTARITGNVIEEGGITLETEDGESVQVQITTPISGERKFKSRLPPFVIPQELMDCKGRFERNHLSTSIPIDTPRLVTRIAGNMNPPEPQYENRDEGEGVVFGSAVHEVLRGRDPELIIKEFGIEDENQRVILNSVYDEFWSLPILSGVTEIHRERAFTVTVCGIPLIGRIDLLVRLTDGTWLVIDYKSDTIPAVDLAKKESYRFQVEIYRRAAEILGMIPVRSALYSLYEKKMVHVEPWSDDDLLRLLSSIEDSGSNGIPADSSGDENPS